MRKTFEKKEKGITLIALVITIIVLLILAGVSIAMLTGENGILNKATTARERTVAADEQEKVSLAYNDVVANKLDGTSSGDITVVEMEQALQRQGVDSNKVNVQEVTGEDKIKIKFTDTNGEYEINTKITSGTTPTEPTTPTANYQSITDLREGDKVVYTDNNGTLIPCTVLYDSTNENYSTYGVQIIADDTVGENVELGNGTGSSSNDATHFATAKDSYNDAIGILNRAAEGYLNTDLATDARCVGSVPNDKNSRNMALYSNNYAWFASYNNQFEAGEEVSGYTANYTADKTKMDALGIKNISKMYWLASRYVDASSYATDFFVHYVSSNGSLYSCRLCFVGGGGSIGSYSIALGLRPVFTLKSDIKVVDGENNTKVLTK